MITNILLFTLLFIIVFIFIFLFLFLININKNILHNEKDAIFFILDEQKKRIIIKNNIFFGNKNFPLFPIVNNQWFSYDKFFEKFNSETIKKIENAVKILQKNKDYIYLSFEEKNEKLINYNLYFHYNSNQNINGYIEWKIQEEEPTILHKNDLINMPGKYMLFVSFKLDSFNISDKKNIILNLKKLFFLKKEPNFFIINQILSIIYYCETKEELFILKQKINKLLMKNNVSSFIKLNFRGTSLVEGSDISNLEILNNFILRIKFSIIKSLELKIHFEFCEKNIYFNEFEEFKLLFSKQIESISSKNIKEYKKIDIYDENQKKVLMYIKPTVNIDESLFSKDIFNNLNLSELLVDNFLKFSLKNLKGPYIVDVNDYDILNSIELMSENKNNIYHINFINNISNSEIISILNLLSRKKLLISINTKNISSFFDFVSILLNTEPHIIFLDSTEKQKWIKPEIIKIIKEIIKDKKINIVTDSNTFLNNIDIDTHIYLAK
ncbi:MAG: hypothetical protein ACRCRP_01205 [Metamycoplasmataceae bacterium]